MTLYPSSLGLPPKFARYHAGQESAILDIVMSTTRFDLLSAPTGSGKTCIAYSVSRLLGLRTLYLVSTKALQDQAAADLPMLDIRGHGNYPCAQRFYTDSIHSPDDADFECIAADCSYEEKVKEALSADVVITNYAHWISLAKSGDLDRLGKFDLLVCDEAHRLVHGRDVIVSQLCLSLSDRMTRSILGIPLPFASNLSIEDWREWSLLARNAARVRYSDLRSRLLPGDSPSREMIKIKRLGSNLSRFISDSARVEWVAERSGDYPGVIDLLPVWGASYAESHLFRAVPRIILCSATLAESDAKYLAIERSDYTYYEVPSTFAPSRRPMIFVNISPRIRVDHRMSGGEWRALVNRIDDLLSPRLALNWKIVIQARSYRYARALYESSKHQSRMIIHDSRNAASAIAHFRCSTVGCILVSPAVEEGHDFSGDECRCQIILKVPFAYARSPLMAARIRHDKSYGNYFAAKSVTQQYGRSTRDPSDWSEVVIFDDHWGWFRNVPYFARWFRSAFREVRTLPDPLRVAA